VAFECSVHAKVGLLYGAGNGVEKDHRRVLVRKVRVKDAHFVADFPDERNLSLDQGVHQGGGLVDRLFMEDADQLSDDPL
jgi:hypothetical protein